MIKKYRSVFKEEIYLTDERRKHISSKHPEARKYISRIREVLTLPDLVKISKRDTNVHLYYKFYKDIFGGKYLLVVVNSTKKIIITMFITDKIKVGELLWQKK